MSEQRIALVQLDWRGRVQNVGGNGGFAARPEFVEAQRAAQRMQRRIEIAQWIIRKKIEACIATLNSVMLNSDRREPALTALTRSLRAVERLGINKPISALLGIEGRSAAVYFQAWHDLPLNWSGAGRKPIPPNWLKIAPRTMGWQKHSINARHPINAMLNYGYGIALSQVRAEIIATGLDPSIGFLHNNGRHKDSLTYDLLEPIRPVVDALVLKFALAHTFKPGDFTIDKSGGCRLNPQMARAVVREIASIGGARGISQGIIAQLRRTRRL